MRVAWIGPRPAWLGHDAARAELEDVELESVDAGADVSFASVPDVVHVVDSALRELRGHRRLMIQAPIVVGLTAEGVPAARGLRTGRAWRADAVVVDSTWDRGALPGRIAVPRHVAVVPRPLDLDRFAPEARLAETKGRGRDLRRFRRFHRLAGPVVLFAGPYTEVGGLDALLEVVYRLRERFPDLRLAAIPHGPSDSRYRDRCEMRALGLGHCGIVEWAPAESEVPFWYAVATVVCTPAREPVSPEPVKRAAAGGRPFVGTDLEPFRERVDHGTTGTLVPVDDLDALEASLEALLGSEDEAARIGAAGRLKAEAEYGPASAAKGLKRVWAGVVAGSVASTSGSGRLD